MRNVQFLQGWLFASLLLLISLSVSGAARLTGEVQRAGQNGEVSTIEPNMALHTGDAIRFSLLNDADAYVYLIAVGSSGIARVIQPLSNKPADAWMAAGEERRIPPNGDFLPLDKQKGNEIVLVLNSPAPIPNLTRVLVRLESRAPDVDKMREVLNQAGLDAQVLAFQHLDPAPVPDTQGDVTQQLAVAPNETDSQSSVADEPEQGSEVVLGGLGSRISAFQSSQTLPPRTGTNLPQQTQKVVPFQDATNQASEVSQDDEENKSESSFGSGLAGLFGFGSDKEPPAEVEKAPPVSADTFPLQNQAVVETPKALPEPEIIIVKPQTSVNVQTNQAPPKPVASENSNVTLVEPLAVEKALQRASPQGSDSSPASDPPVQSSDTELSETGQAAGILASLFGAKHETRSDSAAAVNEQQPLNTSSRASSSTPAVKQAAPLPMLLSLPESQSPAPTSASAGVEVNQQPVVAETQSQQLTQTQPISSENEPNTNTEQSGGLFSWLTGGDKANPEESEGSTQNQANAEQPVVTTETANAQSVAINVNAPEAAKASVDQSNVSNESTSPEDESNTDSKSEENKTTGLLSWFTGSSNDSAAEVTNASSDSEAEINSEATTDVPLSVAQNTTSSEPQETETPNTKTESGIFSWLTGEDKVENEGAKTSENTDIEPSAAPSVQASTDVNAETQEQSRSEQDSSTSLFSWLNSSQPESTRENLDSSSEAPEPEPSEVQPQPEEQGGTEQSLGLLAGIGALFGGSSAPETVVSEPPKEAVQENRPALTQSAPIDEKAPEMTRRKNEQGKNVVVLSGVQTPELQEPNSSTNSGSTNAGVLSGQGSRIQALLDRGSGSTEMATAKQQQQAEVESTSEPQVTAESLVKPEPEPQEIVVAKVLPSVPPASDQTLVNEVNIPEQTPVVTTPVVDAAGASQPQEAKSPLDLNALQSQQNVTTLALNTAPARAVKKSVETVREIDLSDDKGLAESVVLIISALGNGAGVVIDESGHILTNWHLVQGLESVAVAFKSSGQAKVQLSQLQRARVLRHSKFPDLALLEIDGGSPVSAAKLVDAKKTETKLGKGNRLHTLNLADGGLWGSSVATVQRVRSGSSWYSGRRVLHRATVIRAEMEGQGGLHGAPLFNQHGEVTGLTTLVKTGKNQLIAVSAQTIREFLASSE